MPINPLNMEENQTVKIVHQRQEQTCSNI